MQKKRIYNLNKEHQRDKVINLRNKRNFSQITISREKNKNKSKNEISKKLISPGFSPLTKV